MDSTTSLTDRVTAAAAVAAAASVQNRFFTTSGRQTRYLAYAYLLIIDLGTVALSD